MDMSIIRNVHQEPRKRRLIELLCKFAEATEAMIVAEGVENKEEMKAVRECGAHIMQGYFFARPSMDFQDAQNALKKQWTMS